MDFDNLLIISNLHTKILILCSPQMEQDVIAYKKMITDTSKNLTDYLIFNLKTQKSVYQKAEALSHMTIGTSKEMRTKNGDSLEVIEMNLNL